MRSSRPGKLLRIYVGEADKWRGRPLYEGIVLKARDLGLAGATVLRSPMGFGATAELHTAKILRLSLDLPIVIEVADQEERIRQFLDVLEGMVGQVTATVQDVQILAYGTGGRSKA